MMKAKHLLIMVILLTGFLLRTFTSFIGYHGDLNNNISWGTIAYENGLNGFYEGVDLPVKEPGEVNWPYSAPNQPPLTILTFAFARLIWQTLRDFIWYMNWELLLFPSRLVWFWDDHGMTLLVKLPSILADLGIGYCIYKFFSVDKNKNKLGIGLMALWIFNPVTWYNSAVWGQTDAVVNLIGLLGIVFLIKKKLTFFSVLFTLSMLFKGSLGIFIPVLFFYAVLQKHSIKTWGVSIFCSLLVIVLVSVWFHPQFDLIPWLYNLYTVRILPGEIGFLTANAFNFWWLVDSGRVYDSTIYFGLPARIWGIIATLAFNAPVFYWMSKKLSQERLIASLALVSIFSFMFMTRIHERYLFPFFPVSSLLLGLVPGYLPIYALYSLVHLLNLYNLFWVPSIPFLETMLTNFWITNSLSVVNLLLFIVSLRQLKRANI